MKNYVQNGDTITVTAPYAVLSGAGMQVGAKIFGVAANDIANGASGEIVRDGTFDLAKAVGVVTAGDAIYWDNTNKVVTTVAQGNLHIGEAILAALSGDATCRVRLNEASPANLMGSAALDFPSIGAAASADLTITVTGAAVGDPVAIALPAAPQAGLVFFGFVSAANTVTVRAMNITGGALDAPSGTYRACVMKDA